MLLRVSSSAKIDTTLDNLMPDPIEDDKKKKEAKSTKPISKDKLIDDIYDENAFKEDYVL